MAKNTSNSAFRKIDIDQYNEDNYKEDEAEQSGPTGPDEAEVCALLNQGQYIDALRVVLHNAPLGSSNQQVKDNTLALLSKVLMTIKSTQVDEIVANLSTDDTDILMKYIYKGFETPIEGSSGHLLLWHDKVYNAGGFGCIMRVISDRMRV